jgi:hypothetical protein
LPACAGTGVAESPAFSAVTLPRLSRCYGACSPKRRRPRMCSTGYSPASPSHTEC